MSTLCHILIKCIVVLFTPIDAGSLLLPNYAQICPNKVAWWFCSHVNKLANKLVHICTLICWI